MNISENASIAPDSVQPVLNGGASMSESKLYGLWGVDPQSKSSIITTKMKDPSEHYCSWHCYMWNYF